MTWQETLRHSYRSGSDIAAYLGLSPEEAAQIDQISQKYPMFIPPYYAGLIDRSDPADPIRRMCLPNPAELAPEGAADTSGEGDNTVLPGLQHKYGATALVLSTHNCAMYCRHCFRKRMVGLSDNEIARQLPQMAEYIRSHPEISNVLISGGDALLNSNQRIADYLELFTALPQLDFIRFGTRTPVVLPQRISEDQELLDLFRDYGRRKRIYVVTQFNHPRELTPQALAALSALQQQGVLLRNQTVLLRGVNDSATVLAQLLQQLTAAGATPYYIFQCRPARGVQNHFQVPLMQGLALTDQAKNSQNGLGKAVRYVMSHPSGKIEILGCRHDELLCKYHQAKNTADAARVFSKKINAGTCWLNEI